MPRKYIITSLLSALIFVYIYAPTLYFLPISTASILGLLLSIISLVIFGQSLWRFIYTKKLFFIILATLIAFTIVRDVSLEAQLSSNSVSVLTIRMFVEAILPSFLIAKLLIRESFTLSKVMKLLVWVGAIQFLFAIVMFNPDFKQAIFSLMAVPEGSIYLNPVIFATRGYGLSINYLFSFALAQGILIVLSLLIYSKSGNLVYLALGIALLLTVLVNARIGLLPIAIYVVLLLLSFTWVRVSLRPAKFAIFILLLALGPVLLKLGVENAVVAQGLDRVAEEIRSLGERESSHRSTFSTLLGEHVFFADNLSNITLGFGVMEGEELKRSDIGYVRYLTYGGVVYSSLIYTLFFRAFTMMRRDIRSLLRLRPRNEQGLRVLPIFLVMTLFMAHVKGDAFVISDSLKLFFLFFSYLALKVHANAKSSQKHPFS